jgi:hypothetical protein
VIVSEKLTARELESHLDSVLQDERFLSDYLDYQLQPVYHLLPKTAVEQLKLDISQFKTFRFPDTYVSRLRYLLIQRFDGWDVRDFDDYVWRLLHEDAVSKNMADIDKTDPNAAVFWLRILGAITREETDSSSPETVTLQSHALRQVRLYFAQLSPKILLNKDKREVWSALYYLNVELSSLVQQINAGLELKIDNDLNEELLDEWLTDQDERYPSNAYLARQLKLALLGSKHVGKTLNELDNDCRLKAREGYLGDDTLDKLIEHAAEMARIEENNDREEDDARNSQGNL